MPSASDSRQPYRLSNFDLVTESFTLIAGTSSLPSSCILYRRCTPVVVSSETPRQSFTMSRQRLRILGVDLLQQILDDLLFVALRRRVHPVAAVLEFIALVDQQRHVAAVVDHQLADPCHPDG